MAERGLVLVTGITGRGKSTTLASTINRINRTKRCKIITIDDPIEFLCRDEKCGIVQRECGPDTDILLAGEMRDRGAIDIAIKAAETGHLVLSTAHTTGAQGPFRGSSACSIRQSRMQRRCE